MIERELVMCTRVKVILSVLAALAMIPLALESCTEKSPVEQAVSEKAEAPKVERIKKLTKMKIIKPKTAGMLIDFERLFKDQEKAIEAERTAKKTEEHEVMTNVALNQTLEELLELDPEKDAKRVAELIDDLKDFGQQAIDALLPMVDQKLKSRQRRLVIMALGALKGKSSTQEIYKQATQGEDSAVRREALKVLKDADDKDALAKQSVAQIEAAQAEGTEQSQKDLRAHVSALGMIGGETAIDKLTDIIRTADDIDLKKHAVLALGSTKDDAAKRILMNLFEYDADVRKEAAQALGGFHDEDISTMFGTTLLDVTSPEEKRIAAVRGLSADNSVAARTVLLNVLRDSRQSRDIHKEAVSGLVAGYDDTKRAEVSSYVLILERTRVDYMPQMIQPLIASGGDVAADLLYSRYSRFDRKKKIHAIRSLGRIASSHTFKALSKLLGAELDVDLRRELLTAMKSCRGTEVNDELRITLIGIAGSSKDAQERTVALQYLAEKNISADAAEKPVVTASIDVLRAHGSERSKVPLMSLKSRPDAKSYEEKIDRAIEAIEARSER
jgi:HEAT repeat protein